MLRGLYPLVALVAGKRKPPHVERYNLTTERGANLEPEQFKNSRKMLSLQQGGYMTLAQFATDFLARPGSTDPRRELLPQRLSAGGVTGSKVKTGVRLP